MSNTLQTDLDTKLGSPDGQKAVATWLSHFRALANPKSIEKYRIHRARLQRFLGRIKVGGYRAWIPISSINQETNALSVKCQGRKVAVAKFRNGQKDFTISFTKFTQDKKAEPMNEDSVVELIEDMPYRAALPTLRTLYSAPEFQEGVQNYPEWSLEAWLAKALDARQSPKAGGTFKHITPLTYCQMLLQVSSPFSASKADGDGVSLALKANGHSDILVRMGIGPHSRLGVLELKAVSKASEQANRKNISKALCQAFAYAYCYLRIWKNAATVSETRREVLTVLGYGKPKWFESPPPLEAIAVVPKRFSGYVIDEAKKRHLFDSDAVRDESIKLFLWEYERLPNGDYNFSPIRPVEG